MYAPKSVPPRSWRRGLQVAWLCMAILLMLAAGIARADSSFLEPEKAFAFSAHIRDAHTVEVRYAIADGYYLYRGRFHFDASGAHLGAPAFPPAKVKFDETLGEKVNTYRHEVVIALPVDAKAPFTLHVTAQGCADSGLCYAPMQATMTLDPAAAISSSASTPAFADTAGEGATGARTSLGDDLPRIGAALDAGRLTVILPLFFLLGLGLAFTPCVLPMVPILSTIIVGEGPRTSRGRGLLLSSTYALGMAIVYTLLGIAAGLAGEGLAATLQNPWVLGAFAVVMALLSLSMFDVVPLQMPAAVQGWLNTAAGRQRAGKLAGVFVMGALSALVVGPCVAAPLAGTLLFISHTHDVVIGGSALFAMALGMSTPLLLLGASAGTLLPRAGAWMSTVKRFFGVLMLATALWMVAPVLPRVVGTLAWGALALCAALMLLRARGGRWPVKALALLLAAAGVAQWASLMTGVPDLAHPLGSFSRTAADTTPAPIFRSVTSVPDLENAIAAAPGKTVMLDFYADWCVSCKEMERLTFSDPRVAARLHDMVLLRADVTANSANDKALLKRFGLFGPPGIVFFDGQGHELGDARVIGYENVNTFLRALDRAGAKSSGGV